MTNINSLLDHRLRHLTGVSVRNLILEKDEHPPFSVSFALSLPHGDDLGFFYQSREEWNCLHPDWRYIDLSRCNHAQKVAKDFVVSVLIGFKDTYNCRLLRQWRIHVTGLLCVGKEVPPVDDTLKFNEQYLILQFRDFFYTTWHVDQTVGDDLNNGLKCALITDDNKFDFNHLARVDDGSVRDSYSVPVLNRILRLTDERLRIEQLAHEQKENHLIVWSEAQSPRQQRAELEAKRSRLQLLQQQVDKLRERLMARQARHRQTKERNATIDAQLQELKENVKVKNESLQTATNVYQRLRSDLKKYQIDTVSRRLVLSRALSVIFPINKEMPTASSAPPLFSICKLRLPDSDEFSDTSLPEGHFTAAYGFTAQLLRLLSFMTDVPLRYPIVVHRSRLHMRDNIVCQLDENERNFPLHLRRHKTDRIRFAYAVFLLNRDITLLRLACGLTQRNMQSTLSNLVELMRSPLTPSCSAEMLKAAEELIEDGQVRAADLVTVGKQPLKFKASSGPTAGNEHNVHNVLGWAT